MPRRASSRPAAALLTSTGTSTATSTAISLAAGIVLAASPLLSTAAAAGPAPVPKLRVVAGATAVRHTPIPTSSTAAYAARLVELTNQARAQRGLPALAAATCASAVASTWSATMARDGQLVHQSLSNITGACPGWRSVGENIAMGNVPADQIFTMWMNSTGHAANILNAGYTQVTIAVAQDSRGVFWVTQDFVQR